MKRNRKDKNLLGMSTKAGLLLVIVAVFTLEATFIIQYHYSQREIKKIKPSLGKKKKSPDEKLSVNFNQVKVSSED